MDGMNGERERMGVLGVWGGITCFLAYVAIERAL